MAAPAAAHVVCRYLGVAGDALRHEYYPTSTHRCHLWGQREQIDLQHQRSYCLTDAHRRCPWLSVPPAGQKPADRELPTKKIAAGGGIVAALGTVVALMTGGGWAHVSGLLESFQTPAVQAAALAIEATPQAGANLSSDAHASAAQGAKQVVFAAHALAPALLAEDTPATVSAKLDPASGGTVVAGNVGLSFSAKSLAEAGGNVTVEVQAQPKANVPGGPAQFSPNGTIVDINVRDESGKLMTTFPEPVEMLFKYNSADLAMARGSASLLSAAYILDDNSPALENPLHFPVSTWVFVPPSNVKLDTASGTVAVSTQAIGSIFSVVTNNVGYAQTLRPDVPLYSSFDVNNSQVFGTKKQFSYLRVMEPQIGSRLLVMDVDTGNYAYVSAKDVGPSGPPSTHATR
ncbi:MAG TPA: hypothetical protein VKU60_03880 [Chloroflexota bacterium]|nr:hypothetical protein [Chloroflexota bacterium]